jgi:hypothetical protein
MFLGADFTKLYGRYRSEQVTVAAQGLILVRTTNKHLLVMVTVPIAEQPRGSIGTPPAECSEPQNTIGKWDTIQNLPKLAAIGVSV